MPRRPHVIFSVTLASTLLVAPARVDAQPTSPPPVAPGAEAEEARARLARGHELFDAGDHKLALIEFERAYQTLPSYKILYNIGLVHIELGEYARAYVALSRFLAEGGGEVPSDRRAAVEGDLAGLAKRIATLSIEASPEGVEITVGDSPLGRAPLTRQIVDAGSARVTASKPGFASETKVVRLAGGDDQTLRFDLTPLVVAPPPAPTPSPSRDGLPPVAVASWITTGVLGACAIGFGVGATAAASRFETMRDTPIPGSPADAASDLERQGKFTDALALTTDVLIVSTLVAGGVSLYLTLRRPKAQSSLPSLPSRTATLPGFRF